MLLYSNILNRGLSELSLHTDSPSASLGNLNSWKAFLNLESKYSRIPEITCLGQCQKNSASLLLAADFPEVEEGSGI